LRIRAVALRYGHQFPHALAKFALLLPEVLITHGTFVSCIHGFFLSNWRAPLLLRRRPVRAPGWIFP